MSELLIVSVFLFGMTAGAALMRLVLGPDPDLGRVRDAREPLRWRR